MIYNIYLYISCQNTLAALKDEVVSVENELLELEEVEKQQKTLIEVYKTQVTTTFILMFVKFGRQFKTLHLFMM